MGGGVFELGNPEGRGRSSSFGNPGELGGGVKKNVPSVAGSVDFYWYNPFLTCLVKCL